MENFFENNVNAVRFQGGYGIVLTPFNEDGKVNYRELEKQLNSVCESGIKGVVSCGSTSEFTYLSREGIKEIMAFSKEVLRYRKSIG